MFISKDSNNLNVNGWIGSDQVGVNFDEISEKYK